MHTKALLGGLLAAQLVLAAGLSLNTLRDGAADTPESLLDFAVTDVDRIVIDDDAANSTTLERDGEDWRVDSLRDLPANATRTHALLESLAALRTSMPVVDTDASHARFDVAEDQFQRRLRLYDGEQLLGEYFFGTSPGFRRTHGRRSGDAKVYALAFNNFDLPGDGNDWLDKTLLGAGAAQRIKGPDFELVKNGESWQLSDARDADGGQLDAARASALASALESLRVLRVEDGLPEGARSVVDVSTADATLHYEFASADGKYYVRRSDIDQAFTISQTDYERIAGKDRAALLAPSDATADSDPDSKA